MHYVAWIQGSGIDVVPLGFLGAVCCSICVSGAFEFKLRVWRGQRRRPFGNLASFSEWLALE